MATKAELQAQLAAAKVKLAADEAKLADANTAVTEARANADAAQATVSDDLQDIAALEAAIAALPPDAATLPALSCWPHGPDERVFTDLQTRMGTKFSGYKPRGATGQYDGTVTNGNVTVTGVMPLIKNGIALLRPGFMYGNQLNPRVGTMDNKYPVLYGDIANGKFDKWLVPEFAKTQDILAAHESVLMLEVPISEANIEHGIPSAQPKVPDREAHFHDALFHYLDLMKDCPNIRPGISITTHLYEDNRWKWYFNMTAVARLKAAKGFLGVDFYQRDTKVTIAGGFDAPYAASKECGLPMLCCEWGCAEVKGDGGKYKASQYGVLSDWLKAHPDVLGVYLNHGDHATGGYNLDTTPAAFTSATRFVKAFAR